MISRSSYDCNVHCNPKYECCTTHCHVALLSEHNQIWSCSAGSGMKEEKHNWALQTQWCGGVFIMQPWKPLHGTQAAWRRQCLLEILHLLLKKNKLHSLLEIFSTSDTALWFWQEECGYKEWISIATTQQRDVSSVLNQTQFESGCTRFITSQTKQYHVVHYRPSHDVVMTVSLVTTPTYTPCDSSC